QSYIFSYKIFFFLCSVRIIFIIFISSSPSPRSGEGFREREIGEVKSRSNKAIFLAIFINIIENSR
ncbi:hypothetical protein JXR93_09890, partial [bacterium]|nr:hypothetical protein [bacterium]